MAAQISFCDRDFSSFGRGMAQITLLFYYKILYHTIIREKNIGIKVMKEVNKHGEQIEKAEVYV